MKLDQETRLRKKVLESYQILDTLPEQMYDDITQIASCICDMPVVLLSLIDDKRQFFKSKQGLFISEAPLDHSICYHAILSKEAIFQVSDLRVDERFKNNPLVLLDPSLVSYYGVPLQGKEGVCFGSLCVISKDEPKIISEEQKEVLKKLAKQVVYLLELRKMNHDLLVCRDKNSSYLSQMEEFAHTAAHDLRAPLRAVKSFLQLIESKNQSLYDEKDKKYFKFVFDNVTIMDDLIIDLLEFAKSDEKLDEKEPIDLHSFITNIYNHVNENSNLNDSQLILSAMPIISFSKLALSVIFNNLIENALKYKKQDVSTVIHIRYKDSPFYHIFEIQDNGIGISSDFFEIIFKPFKRLHTKTEFSGSGLGLASVKKIIEKLGGTISVNSVVHEGTIFTVSIPKE